MTSETLYARLGGSEAIDDMLTDFYSRIFTDPVLKPFFKETDLDKLIAMQKELFSAALDGPLPYTGRSLYEVHYGRGIERKHFALFVNHLLETLRARGLDEAEVNEVIGRVNTYLGDISGVFGSAG